MRTALLALLAFACTQDPVDTDPADSDPTADTDGTADSDEVAPVFDTVTLDVSTVTRTIDGVRVLVYAPDAPVGMVYVFHGTGGSADVVENTELSSVLNALVAEGFGFVAPNSANRDAGTFDRDTAPSNNLDFQVITSLRQASIDAGQITADTPTFTLGYSAGGAMAGYVAHAAVDAGWPVGAIALHNASGVAGFFGPVPAAVPTAFVPSEHDAVVDPDAVRSRYDDHVAAGGDAVWLINTEERLAPTRFARSVSFNQQQSRQIWQEAVDAGMFDTLGYRQFPVEEIDDQIESFVDTADVIYPKPTRAVLNVVLATHAINGGQAEAEAAFFVDQL